jgi:hypothetical protein
MKGRVDEACKGKEGKLAPAITRQKLEDREQGPVDFSITLEDVSLLRVADDTAK